MNAQLLPKIEVISDRFEAPQLAKKRRIAALLPHDYYESDRRYPVLYLQDGQNLFDNRSPFGCWYVDRQLARLKAQGMGDIIVVGIDHAEEDRIQEYLPPDSLPKMGKGWGKRYVHFMAETLKPFVDENFRTLPDRQNTGIGGSSMGGLISIYSAFIYPELYGKLLIFSPSLWVAPKIYFQAINFFNPYQTKIYLYAGGMEGASMVPNVQRLKSALQRKGLDGSKIEFELSIDPNGQHNEGKWGEEFPRAVEWLFFE